MKHANTVESLKLENQNLLEACLQVQGMLETLLTEALAEKYLQYERLVPKESQ